MAGGRTECPKRNKAGKGEWQNGNQVRWGNWAKWWNWEQELSPVKFACLGVITTARKGTTTRTTINRNRMVAGTGIWKWQFL